MSKDDKLLIHIDSAKKRDDLPEFSDGHCPHCGAELAVGFGMAGGGYGVYTYCEACEQVTSKSEVEE